MSRMRAVLSLLGLLALAHARPEEYYDNAPQTSGAGLLDLFSGSNTGVVQTGGCVNGVGPGCGAVGSGCVNGVGPGCGAVGGGCVNGVGPGCGAVGSGCVNGVGPGCGDATGGGGVIGGGVGVGGPCPQDRVVTLPRVQTQIQQVVNTVNVPQRRTEFITRTSLVPSFVTRTVVQTRFVTRTVFNTRTVTQTNTQQVVSTVQLPDTFNTVVSTVFRTSVVTNFQTRTSLVTRRQVRTVFSTVTSTQVRETVVQVPQVQVQTSFVQVPGPAQTRFQTVFNTREVLSTYVPAPRVVVETRTDVQTQLVTQPVRQPDQVVTITSVQVVPVTSVVLVTRFVPQVVTVTRTVANTVTRTQATTQFVTVQSTVVRNVVQTRFNTDVVTRTQQVVNTQVQERVQTVRLPSPPVTVQRTSLVVVTSAVRGPDTYNTRVVTVQRPREVVSTRVVQQVVQQERLVTKERGGGYCKGHSGYGYHKY